jgi:hypothetical protein
MFPGDELDIIINKLKLQKKNVYIHLTMFHFVEFKWNNKYVKLLNCDWNKIIVKII